MASRRQHSDLAVTAAIHARVSSDDGRQMVANEVQQLHELAAARQFNIFRRYLDEETASARVGRRFWRCRVDQTYIKVNGQVNYLYRAGRPSTFYSRPSTTRRPRRASFNGVELFCEFDPARH